MIIELNAEANDLLALTNAIHATFGAVSIRVACRMADASYDGPNGRVKASKVVARVVLREGASIADVIGSVYLLAVKFDQDCIAMRATGSVFTDMLIGPNANKRQPFNPEFFTPWAQPVTA